MEQRVFRIMSVHNAAVKEAMDIARERSENKNKAFLIEGSNLVEAALDAPRAKVARLFYSDAYMQRHTQKAEAIIALATRRGAEVFEVVTSVMEKICDTETPQGIAAIASCDTVPLASIEMESGPVVVSDGVSDPGNMGAIIRAADAAGASAVVILEGSCDAFSPKALRASAGSIFNVPIVYEERDTLPRALKAKGVLMLVTSSKTGKPINEARMIPPVALVFGSEASGASDAIAAASDASVRIPMRGKAESLNVAASAAVCLYECLRQMEAEEVQPATNAGVRQRGFEPPRFNRRTEHGRRIAPERRHEAERREGPWTAGTSSAQPRDYRDQRSQRDQRNQRDQRARREKPAEQWPRKERSWGEGSWEGVRPVHKPAWQQERPRGERPKSGRPAGGRPRGDRPYVERSFSEDRRPTSGIERKGPGSRSTGAGRAGEGYKSAGPRSSGYESKGGYDRKEGGYKSAGPSGPSGAPRRGPGRPAAGPKSGPRGPRGTGGPKPGGRKKY